MDANKGRRCRIQIRNQSAADGETQSAADGADRQGSCPGRYSAPRCGAVRLCQVWIEGATLRGVAAAAGVDPALVAHYFGSKDALWEAVVDRMSQRLLPTIAELEGLNRRTSIPIRTRLGNGLWQLVSIVCEDPEFGMFLSRAGAEKNERLDLIVRKLLRPHHDAFQPILLEAMRQK